MQNWKDITYLKNGNKTQQKCYDVLSETNILHILQNYDPIVVGTIPINIDVDGSDIDIICHCSDFYALENVLISHFGSCEDFTLYDKQSYLICNFIFEGLEIEVYAENTPTLHQHAYRHMLIEYSLLKLGGEAFRKQIIALKQSGMKTEPAFGLLLGLDNPYQDLLEIENDTDQQLMGLLKKQKRG